MARKTRQYNLLFHGFVETTGLDLENVMDTFTKEKNDLYPEYADNGIC